MKLGAVSVAVALATLSLATSAARAGGIAAYALPQPDAPVVVTGCGASVQFVSNGWGTSFSRLTTSADFENHSTKTAVAVLIRLQLSSVFGVVLDNRFANATGQFSPGASIKGNHWSDTDTWAGLGAIQCSVGRVLFSDGSSWIEPRSPSLPSPSPSPA
jgi:hypothetical protein